MIYYTGRITDLSLGGFCGLMITLWGNNGASTMCGVENMTSTMAHCCRASSGSQIPKFLFGTLIFSFYVAAEPTSMQCINRAAAQRKCAEARL